MKYNVGDKVRIKSLDWYNQNKDSFGDVLFNGNVIIFGFQMYHFCGKIMTISEIKESPIDGIGCFYVMDEDNGEYQWTDHAIECIVDINTSFVQVGKITSVIFHEQNYEDIVELNLGQYEIKQDGDKWYAVKKGYPKTFEECVHMLEGENRMSLEQMNTFRKLIDARNAYWKIAGEEMGLGKSWEPDWADMSQSKHSIWFNNEGVCTKSNRISYAVQHILTFPTKEMRDAFYENFKELIEFCKELL